MSFLIPGFWLKADSWDGVVPALQAAGHRVRALTLPGLESVEDDRTGSVADHIAAVVRSLTTLMGRWRWSATAAAEPSRTELSTPGRTGSPTSSTSTQGHSAMVAVINDELPVAGGEIPLLPDWSVFEEEDPSTSTTTCGNGSGRSQSLSRSESRPTARCYETASLRRPDHGDQLRVPVRVLREFMAKDHPFTAELAKIRDAKLIDLPTGHWPQFTKPAELGAAIVEALA
jgi:hypothetical protein